MLRHRRFDMIRRVVVLGGGAACLLLAASLQSVPAAGQSATPTPREAETSWTVPRTPWGHPDLQGIWTTDEEIGVPMERPAAFGNRAVLTDEEVAKRAEQRRKRAQAPPRPGSTGAGPEHWYEGSEDAARRTSLIVDPPDGRMPPYTSEAKARVTDPRTVLGFKPGVGSMGEGPFDGPEDLHLADRCITRGLPQTWVPSQYNNGFHIVQNKDYVAIYPERLHEARVIPVNGRPPLPSAIRQWIGDSRGRWEGDTLVVEVTNFSNRTSYERSGDTLRLVERYKRIAPDTLRVEITVDDPTTWTKPWTFAVTGKRDASYWQIFEYACHEGNYGMFNILSGARAQERASDKDKP
jgi:hypothetical protein